MLSLLVLATTTATTAPCRRFGLSRARSLTCVAAYESGRRHDYSSSNRFRTAYAKDGIVLVRDFLPATEHARVVAECRTLRAKAKAEADSIAIGRLGHVIDGRSAAAAFAALTAPSTLQKVSGIAAVDGRLELSEYPVEFRLYRPGSGMEWHHDDELYSTPQCELVLTLENTSDSVTEWINAAGNLESIWTPPNSALLVRAGDGGAKHRVQQLKRGERSIVKMVYCDPLAERLPRFFAHLDSFPGLRRKARPRPEAAEANPAGRRSKRRSSTPAQRRR